MALEIERKYLIRMPDTKLLSAMPGTAVWDIVQTYLSDGANGESRRVRAIVQNGVTAYIYSEKRPITLITREEREFEITKSEYDALLRQADPQRTPIRKVRYRVPYRDQLLEIDIYSFWQDRATLEIELASEDQSVFLPEWAQVICDVTYDKRYINKQLARQVPMDRL